MSDDSETKTFNIGMMCLVMFLIGFMFFLYKVEACSPDKNPKHEICHDSFHAQDLTSRNTNKVECDPGATIEVIPGGIKCHCVTNTMPISSVKMALVTSAVPTASNSAVPVTSSSVTSVSSAVPIVSASSSAHVPGKSLK